MYALYNTQPVRSDGQTFCVLAPIMTHELCSWWHFTPCVPRYSETGSQQTAGMPLGWEPSLVFRRPAGSRHCWQHKPLNAYSHHPLSNLVSKTHRKQTLEHLDITLPVATFKVKLSVMANAFLAPNTYMLGEAQCCRWLSAKLEARDKCPVRAHRPLNELLHLNTR